MEVENNKYQEEMENERKIAIKSDDFLQILIFLEKYKNRNSKNKEKVLLKIIGYYEDDSSLSYKKKKEIALKKLKKLKDFYKTLYDEDIETNIYLKSAYDVLNDSKKECKTIIRDAIISYDNKLYSDNKLEFNMTLPEELSELFESKLSIEEEIPQYDSNFYDDKTIERLDSRNMEYYNTYNNVINIIYIMTLNIYSYRFYKYIPDKYENKIKFNSIIDNSNDEYIVNFDIKKEKVKKKKKKKK